MGLARNCPTHRSTEDLQGPGFEAQEEPRRRKIIFRPAVDVIKLFWRKSRFPQN